MSHYDNNLDKNNANFVPLTPLSFLERAKDIYPDYEALIYEDRSYTWEQIYKRCIKFASALEKIGIKEGDTVSVMAFNTPEIFEAHYSVPMTGAVLNTINTRLDAKTVAYIIDHSEAKVLIVDRQLHSVLKKALELSKNKPLIIDIHDKFADHLQYQSEVFYHLLNLCLHLHLDFHLYLRDPYHFLRMMVPLKRLSRLH